MNRRRSYKSLLIIVLFIATTIAGLVWFIRFETPARTKIRNVVLISIDTCRADHLGCYGKSGRATPHIDAVAREGTVFTQAHSTNPLTLPAHCSMLTGTTPLYHRVHDNNNDRLGDSNVTLAEVLRDNGFQTAAFVGAFVMNSKFGLDQGFDTYDDKMDGSRAPASSKLRNERRGEEVSAAATKWLENHHRDRFFLFVHYFDPHASYTPPEPFASRYANDPYAGEIAYTDHCIGQVIARLKSLGVYDSTLIIITADHAESLGEHGEASHSYFVYQSTIKTPLIVKAPGAVEGRQIREPVSIIDVMPTVLAWLGMAATGILQGHDLSADLYKATEATAIREPYIYIESLTPTKYGCSALRGLVHANWKYIWTKRPELYDLGNDPLETNNIVDEHPRVAQDLERRLRDMLMEHSRTGSAGQLQSSDAETLARLKSLGYIGGGEINVAHEIDPKSEDPKDFIHLYARIQSAYALYGEGKLEAAKSKCLEVVAERRSLRDAQLILGMIAHDQGRHADALAHFSQCLTFAAKTNEATVQGSSLRIDVEIADVYVQLGRTLLSLNLTDQAIVYFLQALRIIPDHPYAQINLEAALKKPDRLNDVTHHDRGSEVEVDSSQAHFARALALMKRGQIETAREHLKKSFQLNSDSAIIMNNLAWIMATHRDPGVRKPDRAVFLAEIAAKLTEYGDANVLDTLAVAYAAMGQYRQAISSARKAIALASDVGDQALADSVRKRLELYEQSKP